MNVNDPVPKMPGVFLNENICFSFGRFEFPWSCSLYVHVGVEIRFDLVRHIEVFVSNAQSEYNLKCNNAAKVR